MAAKTDPKRLGVLVGGGALVWVALQFWQPAEEPTTPPPTPAHPAAQTNAVSTTADSVSDPKTVRWPDIPVGELLQGNPFVPGQQKVPVARDDESTSAPELPASRSGIDVEVANDGPAPVPNVPGRVNKELRAVFTDANGQKVALLDDRVVRVGDRIDDHYRVVRIESHHIELKFEPPVGDEGRMSRTRL